MFDAPAGGLFNNDKAAENKPTNNLFGNPSGAAPTENKQTPVNVFGDAKNGNSGFGLFG